MDLSFSLAPPLESALFLFLRIEDPNSEVLDYLIMLGPSGLICPNPGSGTSSAAVSFYASFIFACGFLIGKGITLSNSTCENSSFSPAFFASGSIVLKKIYSYSCFKALKSVIDRPLRDSITLLLGDFTISFTFYSLLLSPALYK